MPDTCTCASFFNVRGKHKPNCPHGKKATPSKEHSWPYYQIGALDGGMLVQLNDVEAYAKAREDAAVESFAERLRIELRLDARSDTAGNNLYRSQLPIILKHIDQALAERKNR